MPMHQPNCHEAERRGRQAFKDILGVLENEFYITFGPPLGINPIMDHCTERKLELKAQLEKVLVDIFVEDVCEGF